MDIDLDLLNNKTTSEISKVFSSLLLVNASE